MSRAIDRFDLRTLNCPLGNACVTGCCCGEVGENARVGTSYGAVELVQEATVKHSGKIRRRMRCLPPLILDKRSELRDAIIKIAGRVIEILSQPVHRRRALCICRSVNFFN